MKMLMSFVGPSIGFLLKRGMSGALIVALTGLGFLVLPSCHTTAGMGRDLQHAGQKIESTARKAHP
jgi:predicted small secreted protein